MEKFKIALPIILVVFFYSINNVVFSTIEND